MKAQTTLLNRIAEDYILTDNVPEVEKDAFIGLFDYYDTGVAYIKGDKLVYDSVVYEVIQPHTSQADWKPNEVPALYKLFYQTSTSDGTNVIPTWKQPQGGHDAYNTGDLVEFEGKVWESEIDNNVWSPSVYGWATYV